MERFYYVDDVKMEVYVHPQPMNIIPKDVRLLGSTDNERIKMAAAAFLKQQPGYSIFDYTGE
jgi:hypothetical protein